MQELFRYLFVLLVALFVLSFSEYNYVDISKNNIFILGLVQCRSALPQLDDRQERSLRNIDYISMCMFRKTRLCDCKICFYTIFVLQNFLLFSSA